MDGFLEVKDGVRIRLKNGKTGEVLYVVPKQLVAGDESIDVARVRLEGAEQEPEQDIGADQIAEVLPDD